MKEYKTVKEFAEEYDISPQYVTQLIRKGKIRAVKVSNIWLIFDAGLTSASLDERLADAEIMHQARKKYGSGY